MLKIRLARGGAKKRPYYSIVVADAHAPRDGRFIEKVGAYDPLLKKDDPRRVTLKGERISEWLGKGAQPTERVERFLAAEGLAKWEHGANPKKGEPHAKAKQRAQERAEREAALAAAREAAEAEAAAQPQAEPEPEPEPDATPEKAAPEPRAAPPSDSAEVTAAETPAEPGPAAAEMAPAGDSAEAAPTTVTDSLAAPAVGAEISAGG